MVTSLVPPLLMSGEGDRGWGPVPLTERLIAAGADLNAADAGGKTALAHVLERGLPRIVAVLRAHGAQEPVGV